MNIVLIYIIARYISVGKFWSYDCCEGYIHSDLNNWFQLIVVNTLMCPVSESNYLEYEHGVFCILTVNLIFKIALVVFICYVQTTRSIIRDLSVTYFCIKSLSLWRVINILLFLILLDIPV